VSVEDVICLAWDHFFGLGEMDGVSFEDYRLRCLSVLS
jgi:hypothetical protein